MDRGSRRTHTQDSTLRWGGGGEDGPKEGKGKNGGALFSDAGNLREAEEKKVQHSKNVGGKGKEKLYQTRVAEIHTGNKRKQNIGKATATRLTVVESNSAQSRKKKSHALRRMQE